MEKNFRVGLLQCRTRQSILFSLQSYKNGRNQAKMLPHHRQCDTLKAFVYVRFNDWKKALVAFDHHKKSELHRSALQLIPNQRNQNVLKLSHKRKMEVMKENSDFGKNFHQFEISRMPRFSHKRKRRSYV